MDCDTYLLPLMYAYNVQTQRSIKVSPSSQSLTRAPPEPATVGLKRASLATDEDMEFPMYAWPGLVKDATGLRKEADKNQKLAERRYKKDHDRCVFFALIIRTGEYAFLDKPSLIC